MLHRELRAHCGGNKAFRNSIIVCNFKRALFRAGKHCARKKRAGGNNSVDRAILGRNDGRCSTASKVTPAGTHAERQSSCTKKSSLVSTDAGGGSHDKAKRVFFLWNEGINDSTPKALHNLFTHCPTDPTCEVCRMTKTTRARCTNRPLERAHGMSRAPSFRDLTTADLKVFSIENEAKNNHQYAPHRTG